MAVTPQDSFHVVETDDDGRVDGPCPVADLPFRINGGYFVLRQGIFDYLDEGDDLVMDGCVRAARDGRLRAPCRTTGSGRRWTPSRSAPHLEDLYRPACSPWAVWRRGPVADYRLPLPVPVVTTSPA